MDLGSVDLNLLVVLDALLRERNVTRAAERLHLSQPAVSTALARLRRTLDDPLLVRHGRNLALTPRAEALIDPVRETLATIEQSILRPPAFDPSTDDRAFSVLGSDYVATVLIRPLLVRFGTRAAGLRIDMRPVSSDFLADLRRDDVDIVVVPDQLVKEDDLPECSRSPVIKDRFVGAVWRGHPLAAERRLTADHLAAWPYMAYRTPNGVGTSQVEDDLDALEITRHVEAGANSFSCMPFMLADTMLITLIPERFAVRVAEAAEIALLDTEFPLRPLNQSAFWHSRRDRDPGHVWLREELRTVARTEPSDAVPGRSA
jgi:DNA-binding transcriptional LysR family regulator